MHCIPGNPAPPDASAGRAGLLAFASGRVVEVNLGPARRRASGEPIGRVRVVRVGDRRLTDGGSVRSSSAPARPLRRPGPTSREDLEGRKGALARGSAERLRLQNQDKGARAWPAGRSSWT